MKSIIRFLKGTEKVVLVIGLLLVIQAYCDLSLPSYTSDILNVGLQQRGIIHASPETIRDSSLQDLALFMPDEEYERIDAAYSEPDQSGIRSLNKDADMEEADRILMLPEAVLYQMQMSGTNSLSLPAVRLGLSTGIMKKETLLKQIREKMSGAGDMTDTYLRQIAVSYVASEYEAQGRNLTKIQNRYLLKVGLKMMLMALLMSVTAVLTGLLASRVSSGVGRKLRESVFERVMKFTNAEMEKFSTASLITRSTNDIQQVQFVIVMLLRIVAYAPILAVFGIVKVIQTRSGMSWIIVVAVIALSALIGVLLAVAMPKFKRMQSLVDRLNLVSRQMLTGIMPIRAFSREEYEEKRFEKASRDLYETQLFTNRTMSVMMPVMMFIMNGVSVLIVWVGSHKVDLGTIQVGDLTAFVTYSMVIVIGFLMMSMISIVLPRAGVAADRIAEVLDTQVSLSDPDQPRDQEAEGGRGCLSFHDVSFTYPGAEAPALSDISFTASPGEVTAVIGSTGCGKTTLVNLIPRFFDVTQGQITLDGIDIRDLSQKYLRDQIGYVPQKGMLFTGTVESNIKYGGDQITDDDMKEAARIAQAEEFILEKKEGYGYDIAQEGANVSGGQRQRLSIARAIAKHPKIYVFDDSFSALDYKTDLILRTELMKYTGDSTVIIVAQRISTILHADKILCMEEGRIAGQGTHEELMKSCPTYKEIAMSQLSEAELAQTGGEV